MKKFNLLLGLLCSIMVFGVNPIPTDTYMNFPLNGNASEMSGNNFYGTFNGGIINTTDRFGNPSGALQFDGSTGYIDIPCNEILGIADFSVSYWACPATDNKGFVFSKEQSFLARNQFRMGGTGDYFGCFCDSTIAIGGGLPFTPTADEWSFYTIVRKNDSINLYINGVYKSTLKTTIPIDNRNTFNYRIGAMYNADSYYKGKIDDLKMFKRVLSSNEIKALYSDNQDQKLNLLTNPCAENDFSDWVKTDGGSGWGMATNGVQRRAWISSYENCTLTQTVDLIGKGFSQQVLDKLSPIYTGVSVFTNNSSAGTITIKVELLGESENVIQTIYVSNNEVIPANSNWTLKSTTINGYGTGLRKIRFTLIGAGGVSGQSGPEFDNAYVSFDIRDIRSDVPTINSAAIIFYPNPAQNEFTIDAGAQSTLVRVYDLKGRLLISKQATPKTQINITTLQKGVYMVKANGLVGKLVKN